MANFKGDFYQTPPMVSAIKKDGVPLYKLARQGKEVDTRAAIRPGLCPGDSGDPVCRKSTFGGLQQGILRADVCP